MDPQTHQTAHRWFRTALGAVVLLFANPARAFVVSEMSVDLQSTWLRSSDGRSMFGLLFEIRIPLDPQRPSLVHGSLAQEERTTPSDEVPLDPLERDNPEDDERGRGSTWEQNAGGEALALEPPKVSPAFLSQLTAAALLAQGYDEAWSRLEGLGTRNRASALLPDVSLRAGRDQDTALRLTPTDSDPFRYTQFDASHTLLEGRLGWRLGRLLFSSEDLGIERLRLARARERQRIIERTLSVFFQWIQAQAELVLERNTARRRSAARWEAASASMRLDAMTAGWFSAHLGALMPLFVRAGAKAPKATAEAPVAGAPQRAAPLPSRHDNEGKTSSSVEARRQVVPPSVPPR